MIAAGWRGLIDDGAEFRGEGGFPIPAYSEFMPPPRLGAAPYGSEGLSPFVADDEFGWRITEFEEAFELRPGLEQVARQVIGALVRLARGQAGHAIARALTRDNPCWPRELAEGGGTPGHERFVLLAPLALSKTQDDKGRVRWTLFGGGAEGPARPFWRSFRDAPDRPRPAGEGPAFVRSLLRAAFGETAARVEDLRRAGFRILPQGEPGPAWPFGGEEPLPSWAEPYLWDGTTRPRGMRYLLTFRPFALLPKSVQRAYRAGEVHLLPTPGSLLFWGAPPYHRLGRELPLALQVPLLSVMARHEGAQGLRVPQTGWLHEPRPAGSGPSDEHGTVRNTFARTHRNARVRRDAGHDANVSDREDRMAHVLFDASEAIGLYGKPMARNAQLWTDAYRAVLDGPRASRASIREAASVVRQGGLFGYRFQFPAMRVGRHEVYWQRPLVAFRPQGRGDGRAVVLPEAPLGHLTAHEADRPDSAGVVELWPRLLRREPYRAAIEEFPRRDPEDPRPHETSRNCRRLLDARAVLGGGPLPRSFARQLLTLPPRQSLDAWLGALPRYARDAGRGRALADELRRGLAADEPAGSITFGRTARRAFEVAYWQAIAAVASGRFPNRNNADCARDAATLAALPHRRRDLDPLGDYLLAAHARAIARAGMEGRALVGELPFAWRTDFDFDWSDGWLSNQAGDPRERDLIVIVPGRARGRAVILADHYDTAYREDRYRTAAGAHGPRLAAPGADDNGSATAALLLAAPIFLELSRQGRLGCDVWLVHLTGEEFPADCLGARHLAQHVVEGTLGVRLRDGRRHDLSGVRVEGVYVMDMIAHEDPRHRGVFQIAPGAGRAALELALHAHRATEAWNARVPEWNRRPSRRAAKARRRPKGSAVPPAARHPLTIGEVRPQADPRSVLYNTDGQIFSDAGIPVVLFMEDYDIDRQGYHDSFDTLGRIDLDYGAALAAIAIESAARVAGAG